MIQVSKPPSVPRRIKLQLTASSLLGITGLRNKPCSPSVVHTTLRQTPTKGQTSSSASFRLPDSNLNPPPD
ncbi:hypothetical protein CRENBAI_012198 [Crenichthys baileyi]|uniref:Uncharacterized protein n=1 Tax=Crenichthys baileyi TaxID=28760 RepID=A0AAV9SN52_9TELE